MPHGASVVPSSSQESNSAKGTVSVADTPPPQTSQSDVKHPRSSKGGAAKRAKLVDEADVSSDDGCIRDGEYSHESETGSSSTEPEQSGDEDWRIPRRESGDEDESGSGSESESSNASETEEEEVCEDPRYLQEKISVIEDDGFDTANTYMDLNFVVRDSFVSGITPMNAAETDTFNTALKNIDGLIHRCLIPALINYKNDSALLEIVMSNRMINSTRIVLASKSYNEHKRSCVQKFDKNAVVCEDEDDCESATDEEDDAAIEECERSEDEAARYATAIAEIPETIGNPGIPEPVTKNPVKKPAKKQAKRVVTEQEKEDSYFIIKRIGKLQRLDKQIYTYIQWMWRIWDQLTKTDMKKSGNAGLDALRVRVNQFNAMCEKYKPQLETIQHQDTPTSWHMEGPVAFFSMCESMQFAKVFKNLQTQNRETLELDRVDRHTRFSQKKPAYVDKAGIHPGNIDNTGQTDNDNNGDEEGGDGVWDYTEERHRMYRRLPPQHMNHVHGYDNDKEIKENVGIDDYMDESDTTAMQTWLADNKELLLRIQKIQAKENKTDLIPHDADQLQLIWLQFREVEKPVKAKLRQGSLTKQQFADLTPVQRAMALIQQTQDDEDKCIENKAIEAAELSESIRTTLEERQYGLQQQLERCRRIAAREMKEQEDSWHKIKQSDGEDGAEARGFESAAAYFVARSNKTLDTPDRSIKNKKKQRAERAKQYATVPLTIEEISRKIAAGDKQLCKERLKVYMRDVKTTKDEHSARNEKKRPAGMINRMPPNFRKSDTEPSKRPVVDVKQSNNKLSTTPNKQHSDGAGSSEPASIAPVSVTPASVTPASVAPVSSTHLPRKRVPLPPVGGSASKKQRTDVQKTGYTRLKELDKLIDLQLKGIEFYKNSIKTGNSEVAEAARRRYIYSMTGLEDTYTEVYETAHIILTDKLEESKNPDGDDRIVQLNALIAIRKRMLAYQMHRTNSTDNDIAITARTICTNIEKDIAADFKEIQRQNDRRLDHQMGIPHRANDTGTAYLNASSGDYTVCGITSKMARM